MAKIKYCNSCGSVYNDEACYCSEHDFSLGGRIPPVQGKYLCNYGLLFEYYGNGEEIEEFIEELRSGIERGDV